MSALLDCEVAADDAMWAERMAEAARGWVDCPACEVAEEEALAAGEVGGEEEAEEGPPCPVCGGLREVWR